jgi:hypothetical protein
MGSGGSCGVVPTPVGMATGGRHRRRGTSRLRSTSSRQTGVSAPHETCSSRHSGPDTPGLLDSRRRLSLRESFCHANVTEAEIPKLLLWSFDQFHFAVSGAVEDHYLAFGIAEDEDVPVAEMGFLDSLFEGHGAHADGLVGADQVNLG